MKEIKANKVLYIKLGKEGDFEKECIENGVIKLDYRSVPDDMGRRGNKQEIVEFSRRTSRIAASNDARQIISFYHEPEDTLWITFYNNKLWWCKAKPEVKYHEDGTKTRQTVDRWHDRFDEDNIFYFSNLSGAILQTQGYRGTICEITDDRKDYIIRKINNQKLDTVETAIKDREKLSKSLVPLIQMLTWGDFEILVDLIFGRAGWQRVTSLGKTQKFLDLDLMEPITGTRAMVQVKSQANLDTYKEHIEKFNGYPEYEQFFFYVHTPTKDLRKFLDSDKNNSILYDDKKIADQCVKFGLVDWLIDKTS